MWVFSLCTFVRFEKMIWPSMRFDISLQNFKKPLDSFSPQIERKRSKEYLVITLAVKESFERFSCLEFVFQHWEADLKHRLKLYAWRLRILRDTSILVFLNENCCLCICFTELYFFYFTIASSLSCDFNRCADCYQSFSEHRLQEYLKCRALKHLKSFKIKNKHKFFIMLERNSVNVHSNSRHSSHYKSENRMAE